MFAEPLQSLAIRLQHHSADEYLRDRHVSDWCRKLRLPVLWPELRAGPAACVSHLVDIYGIRLNLEYHTVFQSL